MGLWRNVAFARADVGSVRAALERVLAARGRRATAPEAWAAPAELQHARAAETPWWALGGFAGAAGWTCILPAPYDVLTQDRGALLAELARALGAQVWQLDVQDGRTARVLCTSGGEVRRAGYVPDELDDDDLIDPDLGRPLLGAVAVADACAAARAVDPHGTMPVLLIEDGVARHVRMHPAEAVETLARGPLYGVEEVAHAIATVFGGDHDALVDNATTIECLIRRARPIDATPSFALFTRAQEPASR